jgi:hypothetical protein
MTNRMNDDFVVGDFVEDKKGIWRRGQTADDWIIRSGPNRGIGQKQINGCLNAALNALCPLGRNSRDVIQD